MAGFALLIPYGPEPIPVGAEGFTIRRSENASIRIADDTVSRLHAYVWEEKGNLVVRDLGLKNGVHVNDVRFLQTKLRHGDRLRLGKSDLRVVSVVPMPDETDRPLQITGMNESRDEREEKKMDSKSDYTDYEKDVELEQVSGLPIGPHWSKGI